MDYDEFEDYLQIVQLELAQDNRRLCDLHELQVA